MNQTKKQIDRKTILKLGIILLLAIAAGAYFYYRLMPEPERANLEGIPQPTYMIYYGKLNSKLIRQAKQYDVVILHPKQGNLTRSQVREIQSAGTCVLGYLSIGEDLRTAGMTPEDMLKDWRFTGDGSGPRVDGREAGDESLDHVDLLGAPSRRGADMRPIIWTTTTTTANRISTQASAAPIQTSATRPGMTRCRI